jgi:hypothetical protein
VVRTGWLEGFSTRLAAGAGLRLFSSRWGAGFLLAGLWLFFSRSLALPGRSLCPFREERLFLLRLLFSPGT